MGAKKKIAFMKELEYWAYSKHQKHKTLWSNGKRKYRYIAKRTCRNKDYKQNIYLDTIPESDNL